MYSLTFGGILKKTNHYFVFVNHNFSFFIECFSTSMDFCTGVQKVVYD